jgi:hypothetical protein
LELYLPVVILLPASKALKPKPFSAFACFRQKYASWTHWEFDASPLLRLLSFRPFGSFAVLVFDPTVLLLYLPLSPIFGAHRSQAWDHAFAVGLLTQQRSISMSITVQGSLAIKTVKGRKGNFCVGELTTDIGTFEVKDTILDQFDDGTFEGKFTVTELRLRSYEWRGSIRAAIVARVSDIYLTEETPPELPAEPEIHDPIDDEAKPTVPSTQQGSETLAAETTSKDLASVSSDPPTGPGLLADFAALIDAGKPVRLDPTVDRGIFRAQRDGLKVAGYKFDAKSQMWLKS